MEVVVIEPTASDTNKTKEDHHSKRGLFVGELKVLCCLREKARHVDAVEVISAPLSLSFSEVKQKRSNYVYIQCTNVRRRKNTTLRIKACKNCRHDHEKGNKNTAAASSSSSAKTNSHVFCCDAVKNLVAMQQHFAFDIEASCSIIPDGVEDDEYADQLLFYLSFKIWIDKNLSETVNVKKYEFILQHFEPSVIDPNSQLDGKTLLKNSYRSSCHIAGCKLHTPTITYGDVSSSFFDMTTMFRSLVDPVELSQMEIRSDPSYQARLERQYFAILTDLPEIVISSVFNLLDCKDFASFSSCCSKLQNISYGKVPGLNLNLYPHQKKGLKWMLYRESFSNSYLGSVPHPFCIPKTKSTPFIHVDCISGAIHPYTTPLVRGVRGGLFCDEPGLGKTITMLALVLRTKGKRSQLQNVMKNDEKKPSRKLRSRGSHIRQVDPNQLIQSHASLIIVPNPLVSHWKQQIEYYVDENLLKVFIDFGNNCLSKTFPTADELAKYDIVVTTMSRLGEQWQFGRPLCGLEARMPERYGFEDKLYNTFADGKARKGLSSLLKVHWHRIIVDEGHKIGGRSQTNQINMAKCLVSDKRWVMTGTPTPSTLSSADIKHIYGLLEFLRELPFGHKDGRTWTSAIGRPFDKKQPIALLRLHFLLSRIMIRHTKDSVEQIPSPIRRTIFICPKPTEYLTYNTVAAAIRANLVITGVDPVSPGIKHHDSLLNPKNRKYAVEALTNLRLACCGGGELTVSLGPSEQRETILLMHKIKIDSNRIEEVSSYMRRAQVPGESTQCRVCERFLQLLMVLPCGHLCCADCIENEIKEFGATCGICGESFNWEVFQDLQPGFYHLWASTADVNRKLRQNIDISDSSKASYVVKRLLEIKKKNQEEEIEKKRYFLSSSIRKTKIIIFSQFRQHILRVKEALESTKTVKAAYFLSGNSMSQSIAQLKEFQSNPDIDVLLLTEIGSHGLDLSFVSHIFLMDEIWDRSLEDQVISRAYRMGAKQSVIVEQLVMRGTVEALINQLNSREKNGVLKNKLNNLYSKKIIAASDSKESGSCTNTLGKPKKRPKRKRNDLFAVKTKKSNKKSGSSDSQISILQQRLHYILNDLRLLNKDWMSGIDDLQYKVVENNVLLSNINDERETPRIPYSEDMAVVSTQCEPSKKRKKVKENSNKPKRSCVEGRRVCFKADKINFDENIIGLNSTLSSLKNEEGHTVLKNETKMSNAQSRLIASSIAKEEIAIPYKLSNETGNFPEHTSDLRIDHNEEFVASLDERVSQKVIKKEVCFSFNEDSVSGGSNSSNSILLDSKFSLKEENSTKGNCISTRIGKKLNNRSSETKTKNSSIVDRSCPYYEHDEQEKGSSRVSIKQEIIFNRNSSNNRDGSCLQSNYNTQQVVELQKTSPSNNDFINSHSTESKLISFSLAVKQEIVLEESLKDLPDSEVREDVVFPELYRNNGLPSNGLIKGRKVRFHD